MRFLRPLLRRGAPAALALVAVSLSVGCRAPDPSRPVLTPVERGDFRRVVRARGRLVPAEEKTVQVPDRLYGVRVATVATEGTRVTTGDLLVVLDVSTQVRDLDQALRELGAARLEVESTRLEQAEEMRSSASGVREKELTLATTRRKLGQILDGPREEQVRAQEVAVRAASRRVEETTQRLGLERTLEARGFSSTLALLEARGAARKAENAREAAARELARLEAGPRAVTRRRLEAEVALNVLQERRGREERDSKVLLQEQTLDKSRAELEGVEAAVERARSLVASGEVTSPYSGTVLHATDWAGDVVQEGSKLWSGQDLVRVVSLDRLDVVARIGERDIDGVRVGARARLRIPDRGEEVGGVVREVGRIAMTSKVAARSGAKEFEVVLEADRLPDGLRPASRVEVAIQQQELPGTLRVVPEAATCGEGTCTLVTPEGREHSLDLVARDADFLYLRGALPGERVLLRPGGPP